MALTKQQKIADARIRAEALQNGIVMKLTPSELFDALSIYSGLTVQVSKADTETGYMQVETAKK